MICEVSGDEWGRINHHPQLGVLELRWRNAKMSDEGFMATLCLLTLEAERLRPHALLVDAREFRHQLWPGIMEWRDASIIPRYGAAGIRRFASQPRGSTRTMRHSAGSFEAIERQPDGRRRRYAGQFCRGPLWRCRASRRG
jgi:hypothetical protein